MRMLYGYICTRLQHCSAHSHLARDIIRFLRDEEDYENGYREEDFITPEECPAHMPELIAMDDSI